MARLHLTLLGGFDARVGESESVEIPIRKERALLAWLAVNADRRVAREAAVSLLWSKSPQKQANASLSQALYSLRRTLSGHGCDPIAADSEVIRFATDQTEVDVLRFSRLVRERAGEHLAEAEHLYGGDFLDGFQPPTPEFEEWMEGERRHLRSEAINCLAALLEPSSANANAVIFADRARRLAWLDPYSEPACRALMLHHALHDRLGAATETFELLRNRLRDELDAMPSDETVQQHARILRREIAPASPSDVPPQAGAAPPVTGPARTPRRPRARVAVAAFSLAVIVALACWQTSRHSFEPVDPAQMAQSLPAKPSIAVLPFDDLSQGEERGYLSEAIAEGIITELSRFPELFVIARNSSFDPGAPTDLRQIARQLGVRYILEGSQQKAGDDLRVTVQLIDTVAGNHVWAATFDRKLADVFIVQDEISNTVASTLGEKLKRVAGEEAKRADPATLRAYEHVLKAVRFFREFSREGSDQALREYQQALAADPNLARAHAGIVWIYINGYRWGWTELDRGEALRRAREEALKTLELAPDDYMSHFAMANVHMQAGERGRAIAEFEKTLELNPNASNVMADLAEILGYLGRFPEAVELLGKAMRLDPLHPEWFYWNLGWAQYSNGECEAARATMEKMSRMPPLANRTLAAIYVCLGRMEDARTAVSTLRAYDPEYSVAKFRLNFNGKYENAADLERWIGDLRKAGLPE